MMYLRNVMVSIFILLLIKIKNLSQIILIFLFTTSLFAGIEGNIVFIKGDANYKKYNVENWTQSFVSQNLFAGDALKTESKSQMGVLFKDRTQIRLGENTFLTIKESQKKSVNSLFMKFGKIFSQANHPAKELQIHTPSVTASIRGTQWFMDVREKETLLIVKEGIVTLKNTHGTLQVKANESALVKQGKAPFKLSISHEKSRINWVNMYTIEPFKHLHPFFTQKELNQLNKLSRKSLKESKILFKNYLQEKSICQDSNTQQCRLIHQYFKTVLLILSSKVDTAQEQLNNRIIKSSRPDAIDLKLMADILIYSGNFQEAHRYYRIGKALYRDDSDFKVLQAQLYIMEGNFTQAEELLKPLLLSKRATTYALNTFAYLQELQGNARGSENSYIKALQKNKEYMKNWLSLGRYYLQREETRDSRYYLQHALSLDKQFQETLGSLGMLETQTNNFVKAESYFKQSLSEQEQNYITLSALGFMQLKQGKNEEALQTLLKAELIEPKYVSTYLHLAVAYYRLKQYALALRALQHANQVDPKNPLVFQIKSIILTDQNHYSEAIVAAKKAKKLLPYLKSMNQILSDSKGSANLGKSFSKFGMYESTLHYANEAYLPLWSGSHFFMADHLSGGYQKNSELIRGFLLDPLSFGASNQLQSIYDTPGNYTSLRGYGGAGENLEYYGLSGSVNGLTNSVIPMSYFADFSTSYFKQISDPIINDEFSLIDINAINTYNTLTLALGIQAQEDLNLFAYYQYQKKSGSLSYIPSILFYDNYKPNLEFHRITLGANYNFTPFSQLSIKSSLFNATNRGVYSVKDFVDSSGLTLKDTKDNHTNSLYDASILFNSQYLDIHTVHIGTILSKHSETNKLIHQYHSSIVDLSRIDRYKADESELHLFTSYSYKPSQSFEADFGLWYSSLQRKGSYTTEVTAPLDPVNPLNEKLYSNEFLPRAGLKYALDETLLVRAALQYWRKPLAYSSLEPILTTGIPLDINYISNGGKLQRYKLQLEYERDNSFFTLYGDYQKVDNEAFSFKAGMFIGDEEYLDRLQNSDIFAQNFANNDMIESDVSTIQAFNHGDVTIVGISLNQLLTQELALFLRYNYFKTTNRGSTFLNNQLPGFPKYAVASGISWLLPWGLSSYTKVTYRDKRYFDNANKELKDASIDIDFAMRYETLNKKLNISFGAFDILDTNKDSWAGLTCGVKF